MKKILGLDLGTTSIGWAFVNESDNNEEKSSIVKLGVRVNPLTTDEQTNFEKGKSISSNADRTLKRSARRNLQRYKLRRENLIEILKENKFISNETLLSEIGNFTTFTTYENRAKAARELGKDEEKITLEDFARILLMINKKRGYKSSRKAKGQDEGQLIDGMEVAKKLYENNLTPGQFVLEILSNGKKYIPDFYRSDLQTELDKIWNFQKQFFNDVLTDEFKEQLRGKGKQATSKIFLGKYKVYTADNKGAEKKKKAYQWRVDALTKEVTKEILAYVITEVNGDLNNSSGYLGAISDRSKELYFNKQTVGQYFWQQLTDWKNACEIARKEKQSYPPAPRFKNQVFYRQDYLEEFTTIWEQQAKHYKELTSELRDEIKEVIIFYQRKLKSQKGLISFCEFESFKKEIVVDEKKKIKTIGARVCPKSSPLFQEFKIWQVLNNLEIENKKTKEKSVPSIELKQLLFDELNIKGNFKKAEGLKLMFDKPNEWDLNFKELQGNTTNAALYNAYQNIINISGHEEYDFTTMKASEIKELVEGVFKGFKIDVKILNFNSDIDKIENQLSYQFWHLLYSFEEDDSKLIEKLKTNFGFENEYARIIANITFQDDYGSLSAKAIKKILPHLKEGNTYDVACAYVGYNHSNSLNKEEKENRILKDKLEVLSKNSLRNPVVEKILNQMVNLVNTAIAEYGKPDEIRIELARELKKNAKEREQLTESITNAKAEHDEHRKILKAEFGLTNVSRNDIIRYKLYKELEHRGYKTLYTNTYIAPELLFTKNFDIEHIIPKSRLFDDSFSNKTLEKREANIDKADETAFDYVSRKFGDAELEKYLSRVEDLFKNEKISKTKYKKLQMKVSEIPKDFIDRDLRDTQYIAKKAKAMMEEVFKDVTTTTGSITDRLREDWQLVDIMQELNWNNYEALGMTDEFTNRDGNVIKRIKDWTKRNDHRHHAMDALTVAFTKRSHVQYLNNLNARSDKSGSIYGIELKELYRDEKGKLRFKPPIPLNNFRNEAKKHLENILVSNKAKNKVVTKNKNAFKIKNGEKIKIELTPRGQLHLETVYGSVKQYKTEFVKVGSNFDLETINKVAKKKYREVLLKRLEEFENNPVKAFTGKNSLSKKPIYLDELQTNKVPEKVKLLSQVIVYTKRVAISPDIFKDSKKNDDFINRVDDIYDNSIKEALKKHYEQTKKEVELFNQTVTKDKDKKKVLETAFSNLDEKPIWLNREKGLSIKRVTTTGIINGEPLHYKKDKEGNFILDEKGNKINVDFVSTSSNHHTSIYIDEEGNLQDEVISFYETVIRVNQELPIVDKYYNKDKGWKFLFTMKQNEYFVFPNEKTGFNPNETDLINPENYHLISPNLYRVQTMLKKTYGASVIRDYQFRHHLETVVQRKNNDGKSINETPLKDIIYRRYKTLPELEKIVKVRLNHLGKIVQVGEY
jgi:CRISPR-associated endonuclease Csn1